jgi:hypothetical protein
MKRILQIRQEKKKGRLGSFQNSPLGISLSVPSA